MINELDKDFFRTLLKYVDADSDINDPFNNIIIKIDGNILNQFSEVTLNIIRSNTFRLIQIILLWTKKQQHTIYKF